MRASEMKYRIVFFEKKTVTGKYLEKEEQLSEVFRLRCKLIDYSANDEQRNMEEYNAQVVTVETYRRAINDSMIAEMNSTKYNVISADPLSYSQMSMRVRLRKIQE